MLWNGRLRLSRSGFGHGLPSLSTSSQEDQIQAHGAYPMPIWLEAAISIQTFRIIKL